MNDLYSLVRTLRERRPSRNRAFDELSAPDALRARKVVRRLDALERDLRSVATSGARIRTRKHPRGVVVTLDFPDVRLRRDAYLTPEEHALLSDDPEIALLLAVAD